MANRSRSMMPTISSGVFEGRGYHDAVDKTRIIVVCMPHPGQG